MSLVPGLPAPGRAAVRAGVIGNFVDQLNIFLPVVALAPALGVIAGPHAGLTTGGLVVVATLLGRPIGAMFFGRIADRIGRTRTTKIAIGGTAVCSLAIAAVPTHHDIGVWTIVSIVTLRFVGGVFLAGEYTSAIPLAMEWAPPQRRGLISGLIMSMAAWAQSAIAFATIGLIAALGTDAYARYGWRIAFTVGGVASLLLLVYYWRRVADAPQVQRQRASAQARRAPTQVGLRAILHGVYAGAFWQMFGLMSGLWLMTNAVVIVLTSRLETDLRMDGSEVALVMGIASVAQAVVMACTGQLSTLIGRRRFFIAWGFLAGIAGPLLWLGIIGWQTVPVAIGAAVLQVITVCGYGPAGAYLCERFPAHVRSTGYGTAYSLSIVLPALWPWWLPWLEGFIGRGAAIPVILTIGGGLVAGCGALGPRLSPHDLRREVEDVARQPDAAADGRTHARAASELTGAPR